MGEKIKVHNNLEELVGKTLFLNPKYLLNKKRLFTTQNWIDDLKLRRALKGKPTFEDEPLTCLVSGYPDNMEITLLDGNHRTALAILTGVNSVPFLVSDIYDGRKRFGFNIIISKISREIKADY